MGCGSWTTSSYTEYAVRSRGSSCSIDSTGSLSFKGDTNVHQVFKSRSLDPDLDIRGKVRECCDSEEHPNTVPVILALDVTGSMGGAAMECAKKLNTIMTTLLSEVKDVEFSIMAIGDLAYDYVPIQMSQFESDVRIAEHLDKVYFEGGGGSNTFESYSLAWYCGLNHAKLDCWKRGKKGIIITLGDEPLNPKLYKDQLKSFCDDNVQSDIDSKDLYAEASNKYDIYHIIIKDGFGYGHYDFDSWKELLPSDHIVEASVNSLDQIIPNIIKDSVNKDEVIATPYSDEIVSW